MPAPLSPVHHAILGPGGVGGLIGAVLAAAGQAVTLIVRPGTRGAWPEAIALEGHFGAVQAPVTVAERLERPADMLWITVKATQLAASLDQIADARQAGIVIPLLNGIDHLALLRERFGEERVVPATISVESERLAPGRVRVNSPFIIMRVAERGRRGLEPAIGELRRFGFTCEFIADEVTLMWSKLVFLAPIALSTTAAEATIGDVLAQEHTRRRLEDCLREACEVASASGAEVSLEAVRAGISNLPAGIRSSMQKDRAAGRPLELDAIAGPIIRGGNRYRIPVPVTSALVEACRRTVAPTREAKAPGVMP